MAGTFMRASAIMPPGMFLSQPPTTSAPSMAWPLTEVSIASAITSRDTSESFIASVPMPMPSVIVGTPKTCGLAPAASSAAIALSTSGWMPALQGFIVECPLATPTIGFSKSPSPNPTARSMARLGERAGPWVMSLERRLVGVVMDSSVGVLYCGLRVYAGACIAIQYNVTSLLIPSGYEYARPAPAAPLRRRRRAAPLRPRRCGAAHVAATTVALDPQPGRTSWGDAARALAAQGRTHSRGRPLSGRGQTVAGAARSRSPRGGTHGRRRRAPAAWLRLARRLRRVAASAQGVQVRAARRSARGARDAFA